MSCTKILFFIKIFFLQDLEKHSQQQVEAAAVVVENWEMLQKILRIMELYMVSC